MLRSCTTHQALSACSHSGSVLVGMSLANLRATPRLWLQVGIALVASVLRARYNRIEPVERVSVQPKGRSYSRTLFARGT